MFSCIFFSADVDIIDSESDNDDNGPIVYVSGKAMPIDEVIGNNEIIAQMTPEEKNAYIQAYQEMYSDMYWVDRFTYFLRSSNLSKHKIAV